MRSPESELEALRERRLLREVRFLESADGSSVMLGESRLVNFGSNDYLGLAGHPNLRAAATAATEEFGTGARASRLVYGGSPPHRELERAAGEFFGTGAALAFANGYCAATGVLGALLQKGDTAILDKRCHASLIDGVRLSGATLRVFPHNGLEKLGRLLRAARESSAADARVLVVTESVFSMDGDLCPLADIVRLKDEHGALLLLDEAHAFGVIGAGGRGLAAQENLAQRIDFIMATFGKAAGSAGGCVAAARSWVELIANKARSFIYSTAPPPAQAAAALAGLEIIASPEGGRLRQRLGENALQLSAALRIARPPAAIIPHVLGDEQRALDTADALRRKGFLVPAIRFPTVPRGSARLRITLSAAHTPADLSGLAAAL